MADKNWTVSELAPETIEVGDRVRLKGDVGGHTPILWMTVIREDILAADQAGNPQRRFLMGAYPFGDEIKTLPGLMPDAVTKEPPPAPPNARQSTARKPANRRK